MLHLLETFSLAQWAELFTDVDLWSPPIRRIWQEVPALAEMTGVHTPEKVRAGYPGTCAVFIVDETAVIKFFPPFAHQDYWRERLVLTEFAGQLDVLPRLLGSGILADRIEWPYLITAFESGLVWRDLCSELPAANRQAMAAELGGAIRTLHTIRLPDEGSWPSQQGWDSLVQARLVAAPTELAALTTLPDQVLREAGELLKATNWHTARPSLVHADLTEDHVLVEHIDGSWHLSCLIDWADAEVANPFYEWVALWFGFCRCDAGLLRAFLCAYDPDISVNSHFVDQMLAYTLLHRFGPQIIAQVSGSAQGQTVVSLVELRQALFPGLD